MILQSAKPWMDADPRVPYLGSVFQLRPDMGSVQIYKEVGVSTNSTGQKIWGQISNDCYITPHMLMKIQGAVNIYT